MWPKLATAGALLSALTQVFLIYLALCRRSRGPVHRAFVAVLASLALWNMGSFLSALDPASHTLKVVGFLGVLAVGPSALAFTAAFAERRLRILPACYWIAAFSGVLLILNPRDFAWKSEQVTNLWRGCLMAYLVLFVGGALLLLLFSLPSAQGKVRRRHYAYLLLVSLFGFAGGLTELVAGLNLPLPSLGGVSTALWAALLAYAILRHRLIPMPLERGALLGFSAGLLLIACLAVVLAYSSRQLESVLLALAVLPLLYFLLANRTLPGLSFLGLAPRSHPLDADALRQDFSERLTVCGDVGRVPAAWQAFAAALFPEGRCRLVHPDAPARQTLETALLSARGVWSPECLQREEIEHEAFLSGRHTPLGRAAHELRRVLSDHDADVLSAPARRGDAPWLALSAAGNHTLSLSDAEVRTLRALAQEVASALFRLDLLEKLRRADRLSMAGSIAARVAHEVKNPLGAIGGAVQVLEQQLPAGHPGRDFLTMIQDEVRRLDRIVRDYLQFACPRPPELSGVDARALLERILSAIKTLPDWRIQVEWDWPESAPRVRADAEELAQVLHNLVQNASTAMENAGRLRLAGRVEEIAGRPGLRVEITDSGCGMDAATLARAFEPFFTTRAKGSGLGLAISRDLLEGMGGRLTLASQPGHGATAALWLPLEEKV